MNLELDPRLVAAGFTMKDSVVSIGQLPEGWQYNDGFLVTDRGESIPLPPGTRLSVQKIDVSPGKVGINI